MTEMEWAKISRFITTPKAVCSQCGTVVHIERMSAHIRDCYAGEEDKRKTKKEEGDD